MTDPGQSPSPAMPAAPELQFDRLEPSSDRTPDATASNAEGIVCSGCNAVLFDEYYSIGGKPICANCRASVETTRATSRTSKAFFKALAYGLGAALAGAAAYFAVVALSGWQVGIFAIALGWMVGRAMQKALPGGGARRYQLLAAALTYFAIGTAYSALGFREMIKDAADTKQDSTAVVAPQGKQDSAALAQHGEPGASSSATPKAGSEEPTEKKSASTLVVIGTLIALTFSMPVMMVFGGDVFTGLIVAIGIWQAWRMTGAPALKITGPFRVGGDAIAAPAS